MRMLLLGDSVPWGQGLIDSRKYGAIVEQAIPSLRGNRTVAAHSGAIIGSRSNQLGSAPGEVPISWPTILQQALAADPADVSIVLMNGGINDVDIRTILNPCTDTKDLQDDIEKYCYEDYKALLLQVRSCFPDAWIVTTGYYSIFSEQSDWAYMMAALPSLGVGGSFAIPQHSVVAKLVSLSEQFAQQSNTALSRAVSDSDDARSLFVPLGFGPENAMFTEDSFLFGLHPISMEPVDEVVNQRKQACLTYFNDPLELFSLFQCMHASAGHPNVQGSARIAERVLAAIQQNCRFEK